MGNLSERDAPHRAERVLPLSGEANEAPESADPSSFDTQERAFLGNFSMRSPQSSIRAHTQEFSALFHILATIFFASGTVVAYLFSATVPLAAFPASEAHNWRIGAKVYLGFAIAAAFTFIAVRFIIRSEHRRRQKEN
ncbi:putative Pantothenate transporter [Seiridium cardinale]|uniref:Pantothenate transporter n=1 Tax=Seiridium cardinale TaxID=138064 RepID=A0ABR2XQE7_9PEZI